MTPRPRRDDHDQNSFYEIAILALCAVSLTILIADSIREITPVTRELLGWGDNAVCVLFLADFLYSFWRAPKKFQYMLNGGGWLDLLSSTPAVVVPGWVRLTRFARITRIGRAVKAARSIARAAAEKRAESALLAAGVIIVTLIISSSIAIVEFEDPASGNIKTAADAMWWAISTMSSAGAGDLYPTTLAGRAVGVLLMAAGVGVVGTVTGLVTAWFIGSPTNEVDPHVADIQAMLVEIRSENRELKAQIGDLVSRVQFPESYTSGGSTVQRSWWPESVSK
jgi:voltage-gated potassium channel